LDLQRSVKRSWWGAYRTFELLISSVELWTNIFFIFL
jgi:hypothetical protein